MNQPRMRSFTFISQEKLYYFPHYIIGRKSEWLFFRLVLWCPFLVTCSTKVILITAVKNYIVFLVLHSSSSASCAFMFVSFQRLYVLRFLNIHSPSQRCNVISSKHKNIWSFNWWLSRCIRWYLLVFSNIDHNSYLELKPSITIGWNEFCPSILL